MIVTYLSEGLKKMTEQKRCIRCHKFIKDTRSDKQFCSDKCGAAWAREQGYERENFHAEKAETNNRYCEQCGTMFHFNDYAKRSGQREAKYCSNKCRQEAYRARKAAKGQNTGYTGNWDDARNDKTNTGTSQEQPKSKTWNEATQDYWDKANAEREKVRNQQTQQKGTQQNSANKGTQPPQLEKRWTSKNAYLILGVTYLNTREEVKKAYRELIRTYHPDNNKSPDANTISQAINWAYGIFKKQQR
jgi:predicted nucleic acid-binding Zn ribbon protein